MQRKGNDQKASVQGKGREVERGGEGAGGSEFSHLGCGSGGGCKVEHEDCTDTVETQTSNDG